jgi:hypothetical protein
MPVLFIARACNGFSRLAQFALQIYGLLVVSAFAAD